MAADLEQVMWLLVTGAIEFGNAVWEVNVRIT